MTGVEADFKDENELYFNQGQVLDVMMSSWFSSSFSTSQNREKKQIATHEVSTPNKNRLFAKLNMGKNFIVSSRASLTTPRLLPLRLSRRSYRNYQSSQSFGSSQNFLKRRGQSGRSGRSYRNQALEDTDGDYTSNDAGSSPTYYTHWFRLFSFFSYLLL